MSSLEEQISARKSALRVTPRGRKGEKTKSLLEEVEGDDDGATPRSLARFFADKIFGSSPPGSPKREARKQERNATMMGTRLLKANLQQPPRRKAKAT